jgi:hypothetical protein
MFNPWQSLIQRQIVRFVRLPERLSCVRVATHPGSSDVFRSYTPGPLMHLPDFSFAPLD